MSIITSLEKFIGNRIRERRKMLRMSQTQLADILQISYQQVQKYEAGYNKFSINRVMQLAQALNVPPSFFYEGVIGGNAIGIAHDTDCMPTQRTQALQVLLVEDNRGDEILFRNAIELTGLQIELHTIYESDRVMDYLQNHVEKYGKARPDIVVLDVNLPKIDGLSLLRQIKKSQTLADIPVAMLTNSVRAQDMKDSYKLSACGFIRKSIDFEDFCRNVEIFLKYWARAVVLPAM